MPLANVSQSMWTCWACQFLRDYLSQLLWWSTAESFSEALEAFLVFGKRLSSLALHWAQLRGYQKLSRSKKAGWLFHTFPRYMEFLRNPKTKFISQEFSSFLCFLAFPWASASIMILTLIYKASLCHQTCEHWGTHIGETVSGVLSLSAHTTHRSHTGIRAVHGGVACKAALPRIGLWLRKSLTPGKQVFSKHDSQVASTHTAGVLVMMC